MSILTKKKVTSESKLYLFFAFGLIISWIIFCYNPLNFYLHKFFLKSFYHNVTYAKDITIVYDSNILSKRTKKFSVKKNTPLRILKRKNKFLLVESHDKQYGWILRNQSMIINKIFLFNKKALIGLVGFPFVVAEKIIIPAGNLLVLKKIDESNKFICLLVIYQKKKVWIQIKKENNSNYLI